ncbi:ankyrin repeat-containing protein ITN1-like [Actinidia eriantha]|uniref:ankyrin repeat-containing protein ITN1-like n=1 Tax=Actinidia eriantha TaxID=165200 RepID=UPI00258F18D5|nr:ankyrin repeat-containing protein ITN1-like [Actinidia eriantha]
MSENKDTALHEAVLNNHLGVVKLLVEEDKGFSQGANNSGETPLYLAAERHCHEIVSIILTTCTSPAFNGPNGRTALHAAVFSGCPKLMRELLCADKDIAYQIAEGDSKKTALHLAALHRNVEAMEVLLLHCPDGWEMKDNDGNTSLHALAVSDCYIRALILHPLADMGAFNEKNSTPRDRYRRCEALVIRRPKIVVAPIGWRNIVRDDSEAITMRKKIRAEFVKSVKKDINKITENNMIVAALIATVTFAAGFTLPGGYDGNAGPNQGMAVLVRKAAFKVFVISNAMAVICSTSALFVFLMGSFHPKRRKIAIHNTIGFILKLISLVAMTIAFITGTYAVLATTPDLGLAIAVCVIGCSFLVIDYIFLDKMLHRNL